jgi:hypothetical protein
LDASRRRARREWPGLSRVWLIFAWSGDAGAVAGLEVARAAPEGAAKNTGEMQGVGEAGGGGGLLHQDGLGGEQARGGVELAPGQATLRRVAAEAGEEAAEVGGVDLRGGGEIGKGVERSVAGLDETQRALKGVERAVGGGGGGGGRGAFPGLEEEETQVGEGDFGAEGVGFLRLAEEFLEESAGGLGLGDGDERGRREAGFTAGGGRGAAEKIDEVFHQRTTWIGLDDVRHARAVGEEVPWLEPVFAAAEVEGAGAFDDEFQHVAGVAVARDAVAGQATLSAGAGDDKARDGARGEVETGVAGVGDLEGEGGERGAQAAAIKAWRPDGVEGERGGRRRKFEI